LQFSPIKIFFATDAPLKNKPLVVGCRTLAAPSRLRKKSVRGEIGSIFGDTKSSPATDLAFLGQLCVIYFFALFAKTTFSAAC
jgi:hypothetical protein